MYSVRGLGGTWYGYSWVLGMVLGMGVEVARQAGRDDGSVAHFP